MVLVDMRQATIILLAVTGILVTSSVWAAKGHELCTVCHESAEPYAGKNDLVRPVTTLCTECHKSGERRLDHAIGISVESGSTGKLPLIEGKIECVTCHDSHVTSKGLLRLEPKELCISCHNRH